MLIEPPFCEAEEVTVLSENARIQGRDTNGMIIFDLDVPSFGLGAYEKASFDYHAYEYVTCDPFGFFMPSYDLNKLQGKMLDYQMIQGKVGSRRVLLATELDPNRLWREPNKQNPISRLVWVAKKYIYKCSKKGRRYHTFASMK